MASNVKQPIANRAQLNATGLSTLTSGSYATTAVKDNATNQPPDNVVEVIIQPSAVSGNKRAVVFVVASFDGGATFQTGANSTDEGGMQQLGIVPLTSTGAPLVGFFSVAAAFGGILPPMYKVVVKNEGGASFVSASVYASDVLMTVG